MPTNRIKELQSKLTGNTEKDARILYETSKQYPDDIELQEYILNTVKYMKSKIKQKKMLPVQDFDKRLSTAKHYIDKKEYEKAIKTLTKLEPHVLKAMNDMKKMESNHNIAYKYFYSIMEYELFDDFYKDDNRTILLLPYDYVSLLTLKGQAYFFMEEQEKSEECFRSALSYDPTCCELLFLLADFHFQTFQWFSFTMDLDKLIQFIYKESDYLKYYQYLSQYYQSYEMDMMLSALLNDLGNPNSDIPLYKRWENLSEKQKQMLDEKNIPYALSKNVLRVSIQKAKESLLENKTNQYQFYYQTLLPFYEENEIKKMIKGN